MKEKIINTLELLTEQFPNIGFTFGFSNDFKKWFLFVKDYDIYKSTEFRGVLDIISNELEMLFISVFSSKRPKKDKEFIEIVFIS